MTEQRSRFADPPVFDIVGHVDIDALTAAAPNQARAPKGTKIGGQWIDGPNAFVEPMRRWLNGGKVGPGPRGGGLVETPDRGMARPTLSEDEIKDLRESYVTGSHIDENGEWSAERKELHEKIVNDFLDGVEPAPEGEAEVWFNGGGPASGKGSFTSGKIDAGYPPTRGVDDVTGAIDFAGMPKPGAVLIDPDAVKMQLPEVKAMRASQKAHGALSDVNAAGGNWAGQSHEESSFVAKMIYAEAQKRNLPIVYDGTGTSIVKKAQNALDNGYKKVSANYMYVEPKVALPSAIERAGRIGRNVSPGMQAGQYQAMPKAFESVVNSGIFSAVNMYDRNGLKAGQDVPKIFEIRPDGSRKILDQAAYDRFLSSGSRLPNLG